VPPETIKKVAATKGQSVRRTDFFLLAGEVRARVAGETCGGAALAVANSDGFLLEGELLALSH
jgi:type IV secretory pathway protease TraF